MRSMFFLPVHNWTTIKTWDSSSSLEDNLAPFSFFNNRQIKVVEQVEMVGDVPIANFRLIYEILAPIIIQWLNGCKHRHCCGCSIEMANTTR